MNNDNPFKVDLTNVPKEKIFYSLAMFPYPSGAGLHVGHAMNFTANDIVARFKRMSGFSVLNPIGWDSFGLPTEGYAMKVGKPAQQVTQENIANFIKECKLMDWSYDWDREFATSSPEYYKWTQWIFQQLFKNGLVYRKEAMVNRCPQDQTVLANDQVVDGKCERCGTEVIQKKHMQWFIKITDYAERLILDLDLIDWPEETKTQQKYWIGKSEGALIQFRIQNSESKIEIFTTRPDTIYGVTAIVLAPENNSIDALLSSEKKAELEEYRKVTGKKTNLERQQDVEERSGFFSGIFVMHPLTGEQVPVWYADYVLVDYATGAVMFVPAHDERDWEFAKKHGLKIKQVIKPVIGSPTGKEEEIVERNSGYALVYDPTTKKYLCIVSSSGENGYVTASYISVSFPGGGIDEGEEIITGALREIQEETGYTDIKCISDYVFALDAYHYSQGKKQHRQNHAHVFYCELQSDKNVGQQLTPTEAGYEVKRFSQEELEKMGLAPLWKTIFESGFGAYTQGGVLMNSGEFDGLENDEAKKKIIAHLQKQGAGKKKVTYKLRDWSVSRQRYWGSPIPVYYEEKRVELGEEKDNEEQRQSIVAIVYNPKTEKYLSINWGTEKGGSLFIGGGREEGESAVETAVREIQEETGYINVQLRGVTNNITFHYVAHSKNVNRCIDATGLYFELVDEEQGVKNIQSDEDFSVEWISAEQVEKQVTGEMHKYIYDVLVTKTIIRETMPQIIPEEELPVVLPLDVENYKPQGKSPLADHATFPYYTPQNSSVPLFEMTDEMWKFKQGEPVKTRKNIQALIKDRKSNKFLMLQRKVDGSYSFVSGGIEAGEDQIEALRREISEEAGFSECFVKQQLGGETHKKFYHAVKNSNYYTCVSTYYVEVDAASQQPVSAEELAKHQPVWMTKEEILKLNDLDPDVSYFFGIFDGTNATPSATAQRFNQYFPQPTYLRECDTLDTFMCSSFYFLRFVDPKNEKELISKELADKALPVDFYIGGKEHTYGHLLYSRFIHKFLFDQGYLSCAEPFQKLFHQGMLLGPDSRKMSKRWGNVITPQDLVNKYGQEKGIDILRTYTMFMGPLEIEKAWNDSSVDGVKRFLERVERLTQFIDESGEASLLDSLLHKTIKGVSEDIEKMKFNTAVSKLMVFVNEVYDKKKITKAQLSIFVQLLAPFATRLTQTMWLDLGNTGNIHLSQWPTFDPSKIAEDAINLPVQMNGKMRGTLEIAAGISQDELLEKIKADERFAPYIEGKEIAKIIFVQDKIINIITKS